MYRWVERSWSDFLASWIRTTMDYKLLEFWKSADGRLVWTVKENLQDSWKDRRYLQFVQCKREEAARAFILEGLDSTAGYKALSLHESEDSYIALPPDELLDLMVNEKGDPVAVKWREDARVVNHLTKVKRLAGKKTVREIATLTGLDTEALKRILWHRQIPVKGRKLPRPASWYSQRTC